MNLFPLHLVPNDTRIDFMRLRWISISIAVIMAVVAIGAIAFKGFNFALDFTGGTVVELRFQTPPNVDGVRERLEAGGYGKLTEKEVLFLKYAPGVYGFSFITLTGWDNAPLHQMTFFRLFRKNILPIFLSNYGVKLYQ